MTTLPLPCALGTHGPKRLAPQVLVLARLRTRGAESWLPSTEVALPDGRWPIEYGPATSPEHATDTGENAEATMTGRIDASTLADHPVIVLVRT